MNKRSIEFTLSRLAALILALIVLFLVIYLIAKYGSYFSTKIKEFLNMFSS